MLPSLVLAVSKSGSGLPVFLVRPEFYGPAVQGGVLHVAPYLITILPNKPSFPTTLNHHLSGPRGGPVALMPIVLWQSHPSIRCVGICSNLSSSHRLLCTFPALFHMKVGFRSWQAPRNVSQAKMNSSSSLSNSTDVRNKGTNEDGKWEPLFKI
jgi:hypothetical protein